MFVSWYTHSSNKSYFISWSINSNNITKGSQTEVLTILSMIGAIKDVILLRTCLFTCE